MAKRASSNRLSKASRKLGAQQSVDAAVWSICDVMSRGNVASALQYVPELTWILFLRILDETEEREALEAKVLGYAYTPSISHPSVNGSAENLQSRAQARVQPPTDIEPFLPWIMSQKSRTHLCVTYPSL